MSIVITGATGHFGRLVVEFLLDKGVDPSDITAAGRAIERLDDLKAKNVNVARIDYEDPESLDAAFAGADKVLLVSGNEFGKRTAQHRNVIEAAKRAQVSQFVYTSVLDADHSPLFVAPEHRETEELLKASGLNVVILRNGWYTENYIATVQQAIDTGHIISAAGQGRVASAPRADYAEAAAIVLASDKPIAGVAVFELSGDEAWNYQDLANVASKVTGRDIVYKNVSPDELRRILTEAGVPKGGVDYEVATAQDTANGALSKQTGDLSRLLGRETTSLESVLSKAFAK